MSNYGECVKRPALDRLGKVKISSRKDLLKKLGIKNQDKIDALDAWCDWLIAHGKSEGYEDGRASMANDFKKLLNIKETET